MTVTSRTAGKHWAPQCSAAQPHKHPLGWPLGWRSCILTAVHTSSGGQQDLTCSVKFLISSLFFTECINPLQAEVCIEVSYTAIAYPYTNRNKPEADFGFLPRPATLKILPVLLRNKFLAWQLFPTRFFTTLRGFISVVIFDSLVPRFWYVFLHLLNFYSNYHTTLHIAVGWPRIRFHRRSNQTTLKQSKTKSLSKSDLWWQKP